MHVRRTHGVLAAVCLAAILGFMPAVGLDAGAAIAGSPNQGQPNRNPTVKLEAPSTGQVGVPIKFRGIAIDPDGDKLALTWNFGDKKTGSGEDTTHTYPAPGSYTVTLTASDRNGGTATAEAHIVVTQPNRNPTVKFELRTTGHVDQPIQFKVKTSDPDGDKLTIAWDFGDQTKGAGADTMHTYVAPGTYVVTVTVSDGRGGTATHQQQINIKTPPNRKPTASIEAPATGQAGVPLTFTGTGTDPDRDELTLTWDFGDHTTGVGEVVTHTYSVAGSYRVTLTVRDGHGREASAQTKIIIKDDETPNHDPAASAGGPYSGQTLAAIAFHGTGTDPDGDPLTFTWSFGDQSAGSGASPTHAYASAGNYTATLTVSDGRGGTATATATVTVTDAPAPNHDPTAHAGGPYSGQTGAPITFNGSGTDADGDTLTLTWSFGDQSTGSGASPSHAYAAAGTYIATLTVTDGRGGSASAQANVVISDPPPPNQDPTANAGGPYAGQTGAAIAFSGSGTDPDGDTVTLTWNFGDQTTGAGSAPMHAYAAAGSYTVTLTVTDGRGGTATATAGVVVTNPPIANRSPTADAGGPYASATGAAIAFSGVSSIDPDQDPLSFAWLFGDGSAAAGVAPTHSYAATGSYTVTLIVGDGRGGVDTATTLVQVSEVVAANGSPIANAGGPYVAIAGQAVLLNAAASSDPDNDPLLFAWTFGDGQSATGAAPSHTYARAGEYAVSLMVADGRGGSDLATARVMVSEAAVGNQAPSVTLGGPYAGLTGSPVDFAAIGSDPDSDPLTFAWSFGDGSSGTGATPSHRYLTPGPHTVVVTVSDQRGGSATASTTAEISGVAGNTPPIANAGGPYLGVPGQAISFSFNASSDADNDPLTFTADFGDGGTAAGNAPNHTYAQAGTYVVTLLVSDGRGGTSAATTSAVVTGQTTALNGAPTADAGGPYTGAPGQPVQFDGSASTDPDSDPLTFSWSFGDGATGTTASAAHIYASPGQYTVALLVTDGRGGMAAASATAIVTIAAPQNQPPTASAGGPYSVTVGESLSFAGGGTDADGDTLTLSWNFGDGSSGSGSAPAHVYQDAGDYRVVLLVSDGRGGSATTEAVAHVTARPTENRTPVASAGGPYTSVPQSLVVFDGSQSIDPDGDALTFAWNFGDGTSGSGPAPSHAYAAAGAYVVVLTVTDSRGQSASSSTSAVIGAVVDRGPPIVTLNAPAEALPGTSVVVTATAADDVAVTAVTFEVSGAAASEATTAPYRRTIQVPSVAAPGATIQIRAIARDPSNNTAQAEAELRITFQPDTENPHVSLVLPPSGTPGASVPISATAVDNVGIARVVFLVAGVPISEDEQSPYEATVHVPANAAAGSALPITARAVDFSGNAVEGGGALSIVSDADTIAPTVSLTAPAEILRGGTLHLSAIAADNTAVYAVTFFINDVPLYTDTTAPYAAGLPLGTTQQPGTILHLKAVARDFAGLEGVAIAQSLITAPAAGGRGIIVGEVYDDTTGLPLEGATVSMTGRDDDGAAYAESTASDARGRYILRANTGVAVLQITRAGWTRVDRTITIAADQAIEAIDARLTRFAGAGTPISPVLGGVVGPESDRLTLLPGTLQSAATLGLTAISQQGLQGILPPGWSPVGGADVSPHDVTFNGTAQLRVLNRWGIAEGTALIVARWDEQASAWRAVAATVAGGLSDPLQADVAGGGQYVWLLADTMPASPPQAEAGNLIGGVAEPVLPADVQTVIDPQPRIVFYQPGVRSSVRGTVTAADALSSGLRLWATVTESYSFVSGAELHPESFTQDLFTYQIPAPSTLLAAVFPATPSTQFDALSLQSGVIALDVFVPPAVAASRLVGSGAGGTLEGAGGATLIVPPNALAAPTPFELQSLAQSGLGFALPAGLEFVGAAQIGFPGGLGASATLSLPLTGPAPDTAGLLVVRVQEVKGQTRLVLAGVGRVEGARLVSSTIIDGQPTVLTGVRESGRYLFVRVTGPIGFATGSVTDTGGAAFSGALISAAGLPVIALSRDAGAYIAAIPVGAIALTAVDLERSDSGTAIGTLASAGQIVPIDIALVAQTPRVVSVTPAAGSQNVALASPIVVTFSEPVDASTVGTGADITLSAAGGSPMPGTVTLTNAGTTLTFRASEALDSNTRYTVTIGTGIRDLAGYALAQPVVVAFDSLDTTPPPPPAAGAVSATVPAGGNTTVVATQGTAGPRDTVEVFNVTQGTSTPVLIDPNGGFSVLVVALVTDRLEVRITDQAGNRTVVDVPRFTQVNADGSVSTSVGPEGGRVNGPGGVAVDVAAGTFPAGALVTVKPISEAEFPVQIPAEASSYFGFNGAFQIDFGGAEPTRYVNVSIPALGGETERDQWIVSQVVEVNGQQSLSVVDTAKFINGRIQTSSPPCPGVTAAGVYSFHRSTQSVGLNFGVMRNNGYGSLVARADMPFLTFMAVPFLAVEPARVAPVCFPVLTGRVTVVPNSVAITIDGTLLTPADREIVVKNTSRVVDPLLPIPSENHFPRNVVEQSFEMPGRDRDAYQVKAIHAAGELVLTGVTIAAAQTGFVTLRPDPDLIAVSAHTIRILNVTTGATRDYPQQRPNVVVNATGGPADAFEAFIVNVDGVQRPIAFTVDGARYGPGNLRVRADVSTIDPSQDEIDQHCADPNRPPTEPCVDGPARTRVTLTNNAGLSIVIPPSLIVQGGLDMGFDGDPTATYRLRVEYDTAPADFVDVPNFRMHFTNPQTGQVIRTITLQAPPRDEPLNLGVISSDVTPPIVLSGPTRLVNFDPSGTITFTFSEGMDANSLKNGITIRDSKGSLVAGEIRVSSGNRVATFVPSSALRLGEDYRVTLKGNDALGTLLEPGMGNGVLDASGNSLATMRLTITTFKPRLVSNLTAPAIEPVKDLVVRKATRSGVLETDLLAATDTRAGGTHKFVYVNATDPLDPLKLAGSSEAANTRMRVTLVPNAAFRQHNGVQFNGDLAVSTTFNTYYSFLNFYDVTDPLNIRLLGNKLLTATPDTLTDFNRRGTYHQLGFAKGVATLVTQTATGPGLAAYAAVEEVGLMIADVGNTIPERGPADRVREAILPGDFTDVAAFNGQLVAVNRSGKQLVVVDPLLSPKLALDLPQRPRRLIVVSGYPADDNRDGVVEPAEFRDLAIIGTEDTRVVGGVTVSDGSIIVVDITNLDAPQIISTIPMPMAVRELDIDVTKQRLFAGTTAALHMIDLSRPALAGSPDSNGDNVDDRLMWQTDPAVYSTADKSLNGIRLDADRGLLYAGHTKGLDFWGVYDNCCDLGVEMTAAPVTRQTGNRQELLKKEKDALRQEIAAGLAAAAATCAVQTPQLSVLEQGSGACIWRGDPSTACSANYQPGVSDHDFEVFFPASVPESARTCAIRVLNDQFVDDVTRAPKEITINGSTIEFEDITFFAVSREEFEGARLSVMPPPASGGSDAIGDMGLGRQQLLLKWLLEGQYIDVPGLSSSATPLETILTTLKTSTGIPGVEGFEWSALQGFNLAKSKARLRIKGASKRGSAFHALYVKQLHDAAKAGIRATLARMVAHPEARQRVLDITRARYDQNGCVAIEADIPSPSQWRDGPCDSFEEFVASAAARTLRAPALNLFTRAEVVDAINRFYRVKSDLEVITSEAEADTFIALVARFIDAAALETRPVFDVAILTDPQAAQRQANVARAQTETTTALASTKIAITPYVFNRGYKTAQQVALRMYHAPPGGGAPAMVKQVRRTLAGGDKQYLGFERDGDGLLVLDANGKAQPIFSIAGLSQIASPGAAGQVVFSIDLPEKKVKEAVRDNNFDGFFYYALNVAAPSMPPTAATPPAPPDAGSLAPSLECNDAPALTMTQAIIAGTETLDSEALLGFGETIKIRLVVKNMSGEVQNDVTVCSSITNFCYNIGSIAVGAEGVKEIDFTVPTVGFVQDAIASVSSNKTGIVTAAPLRLLASRPLFTVVPFTNDPNPETSEVMVGGKALRYYKVVHTRDKSPVANAAVTVEASDTDGTGLYPFPPFTTNADGLIVAPSEEGMAMPFTNPLLAGHDFDVTVNTINGMSAPGTGIPWLRFPLTVKPREFEQSYTRGVGIKGSIGIAALSVEGTAEAGSTIKQKYQTPSANSDPLELSIALQAQAGLKTGVEFTLFGIEGKIGIAEVELEATAGASHSSVRTWGAEYAFPYPLDQQKQCAISKLTMETMFGVNPLFSMLLDRLRAAPCGSPAPYLRTRSSEHLQSAENEAKIEMKAAQPSAIASKKVGVKFGANGGGGFAIGVSNERGFTFNSGATPILSSSKEGYSLKGNIDFSAGLNYSLNNAAKPPDTAISVGKFKAAVGGSVSSTEVETHTVSFETTLTGPNANPLKPSAIEVGYEGTKGFGWKRNILGLDRNLGRGQSSAITYRFETPDDVDQAIARLATIKAIRESSLVGNLAVTEVPFIPSVLNDELAEFHSLIYSTRPSYEIKGGAGDGLSLPIGITGKLLGFKLGGGIEIKSDNKVSFTKERGIGAGGRLFALEKYTDDQFIPDPSLNLFTTIETAWEGLIASFASDFSDQSTSDHSNPAAVLQSTHTARMVIDMTREPQDFTAGLFSYQFREIPGPVAEFRHTPSDTSGPAGQPHYGIGSFHQFTPSGHQLAQPTQLVIDYRDEDIVGLDESTFDLYAWNETTADWDLIPGVKDPAANTITITTDLFRLYTLAPSMPARTITLTPTIQGGGGTGPDAIERFTVTSGSLVMNNGQPVADGTLYTVRPVVAFSTLTSPYGTVLTPDADPSREGIQVAASGGTLQFEVEYPAPNGAFLPGRIVVYSTVGTAYGEANATRPQP